MTPPSFSGLTGWAGAAVGWLLSYLLHSTLLLAFAGLAAWCLRSRALALEERVWKAALLGGLATASLQLALGLPLAGSIDLAPASGPGGLPPAPAATLALAAGGAGTQLPAPAAAAAAAAPRQGWAGTLVVLWAAGGAFFAAGLGLSWLRFRRRIAGRQAISSGPLPALVTRLAGAAGAVRLTASRAVAVPFARGLRRPEICLPERVVRALPAPAQETIVAHEVAHLLRRDPAWLGLLRVLEAVLFLQPLNRLARRRLAEIAEYRCDDWAVARTGRRLELARCLTEVAGWMVAEPRPLPAAAMAVRPTTLGRRVRRLVRGATPAAERAPRWSAPLVAVALLLVALLAPGVSLPGRADTGSPAATAAEPMGDAAATPPTPLAETGRELLRVADEMSRLARSGAPTAAEVAGLIEEATLLARAAGELTDAETQRRLADGRRRAAEVSLAPQQLEAMADEARALARRLAPAATADDRSGAARGGEAGPELLAEAAATERERHRRVTERHRREAEHHRRKAERYRREAEHQSLGALETRRLALTEAREELARHLAELRAGDAAGHRQTLAEAREEIRRRLEEMRRVHAEARQQALVQARQGLERRRPEIEERLHTRRRELEEKRGELERRRAENRRQGEETDAEGRPGAAAEIDAEIERQLERTDREIAVLDAEAERVARELARAEAELARELEWSAADFERNLERELARAEAEIERQLDQSGRELARAAAEIERQLDRIGAELARTEAEIERAGGGPAAAAPADPEGGGPPR